MALDLAHRHAAGVQGDDLVVEAGPAGLVLGDQLGFEGALAVAPHLDGQFAELALERLPALAVASVAAGVDLRFVSVVAEVLGQFGVQRLFYQQLGQLLEQAVLADQVFRFLVISQQFRRSSSGTSCFLVVIVLTDMQTCACGGLSVYTKFCTPSLPSGHTIAFTHHTEIQRVIQQQRLFIHRIHC